MKRLRMFCYSLIVFFDFPRRDLKDRLCWAVPHLPYVITLSDKLSEEDKLTVRRAAKIQKFLSRPFHVAEVCSRFQGEYAKTEDTIRGFAMILDGRVEYVSENDFSIKGTIEEIIEGSKI
jgi:F0F1-type ATP synthase beta subunit